MSQDGPRWVLIVDANQPDLYKLLREKLQDTELVVVLERRQTARRPRGGEPERERRRAGRRQGQPVARVYTTGSSGAGEGRDAKSGPAVEASPCPECGVAVEFQMPPVGPPPDRVEMTDPSFGVQHYVELRAFRSGGPPSVQRVQAWRRMPRR